jgi:hypothetical protein
MPETLFYQWVSGILYLITVKDGIIETFKLKGKKEFHGRISSVA